MCQRFTERARRVILLAQQAAIQSESETVDSEHMLVGLRLESEGMAAQILQGAGISRALVDLNLQEGEATPSSEKYKAISEKLRLSFDEVEGIRAQFKVDAEVVRQVEEKILGKLRRQKTKIEPKLAIETKRCLELAADEARRLQRQLHCPNHVGTEHLLLGLLRQEDSTATKILEQAGLNLERARKLVVEQLRSHDAEAA